MGKDLTKGIVVRGLSNAGAFTKADVDRDDRLLDASVNASEANNNRRDAAAGMTQGNFAGGFATSTVEKIIQKGGRVRQDPQQGNAHHCQIFGLSLKDANTLFSNHLPWASL